MQRAEDSSSRLAPDPARSGLKPTTAFLLLSLVITAIGALVFLTRPTPAPQPTGTTTAIEPSFALTNEQAITRLEDLHELELDAYRAADPSLIDQVFTTDSPIAESVRQEVMTLVRDRVLARPEYSTLSIAVVTNSSSEIELKQIATVESHFFDQDGKEITSDTARQRQTIVWTLHLVDSQWLLHDAVVTKSSNL